VEIWLYFRIERIMMQPGSMFSNKEWNHVKGETVKN
jgi:hypothetical protein